MARCFDAEELSFILGGVRVESCCGFVVKDQPKDGSFSGKPCRNEDGKGSLLLFLIQTFNPLSETFILEVYYIKGSEVMHSYDP